MDRLRFALFSDVHGNLAALRAVRAAIEKEQPVDHVVVAGDHLQGGPRPREVWDLLTSSGWILLKGNEDEALVVEEPLAGRLSTPYDKALRAQISWTREKIGPTILSEVAELSEQWRIATPAGDLLVVHASPRSMHDRAGAPHNSEEDVRAAYGGTGATAIAFGHFHRSFVRTTPFALLINVASVGLPVDNRPFAAYTILTANHDGWVVEQRRIPYRHAAEAHAARTRGMPPWVSDGENDDSYYGD